MASSLERRVHSFFTAAGSSITSLRPSTQRVRPVFLHLLQCRIKLAEGAPGYVVDYQYIGTHPLIWRPKIIKPNFPYKIKRVFLQTVTCLTLLSSPVSSSPDLYLHSLISILAKYASAPRPEYEGI